MLTPIKPRPALPIAIQRYLDVALYLLVLTGVGTLASTGTLGLTTILFVGGAMLFRGYLLAEKRTLIIPEKWTSFLTIAYVVFYLADYFLISGGFLGSTVHLVLFVMVVRLFSAPRDRDQYLLMVISFLMVLAAAVLTVDSVFLFTFTAFIFMAIITCILMEMKQAAAKAAFQSANPVAKMAHRRMAFSLLSVAPGLVLLIALGGTAIFFVLPRASGSYMGNFSQGADLTTGFSDHVELGGIGRIQQSNALVMHIAISGDKTGAYDLKWRGISLNVFDGRTWSDSHAKYVIAASPGGRFVLRDSSSRATGRPIHYQVLMEPIGSGVFFLASSAQSLQGHYGLISGDSGGAVFDEDAEHPINEYEATSSIGEPTRSSLRVAAQYYPDDIAADYESVPALDPRISELAQLITAKQSNNYDRAIAIENYLRSHYGYTLQLSRARPRDPLAEFLFVRKQGHCEYFASSMAIMLRTLGIPSRVVNGFRTGEFNDLTGQYLIRESDAHSWVEAYFPGYGWASFDPTPAGSVGPRSSWNRTALYLDAMASFWREWVVTYDSGHQSSLGHIATRDSLQSLQKARKWMQRQYSAMVSIATRVRAQIADHPLKWACSAVVFAVFVSFATTASGWSRVLSRRNLSNNPEKSPRAAASIWYERMLRKAARKGWQKLPTQTPLEFLALIEDEKAHERIGKFTESYERARFGGSPEEAASLEELYREISHLEERKQFATKTMPSAK
jgi:hypothetical protein